MTRINDHYLKLESNYLFAEVRRRVEAHATSHPEQSLIWLGIGDVTQPLPPACIDAMQKAVAELALQESFRGYGPEQGYAFLREAIARHDFQARGADIHADEIFISDGAKCDTANLQEIFASDSRIAVTDPVYPVYVDTNVMAGRTGAQQQGRYAGLVYLDCTPANHYEPALPDVPVDLVYLCSPNNPTGATLDRAALTRWVEYARREHVILLFDAAYEAFIQDDSPHSIYEIPGAREVAIEFRSFSKTAGFTGVRCAYTVVPKDCMALAADGHKVALHALWHRRQSTKFNGVSYPVQRAAEAVYSAAGQHQTQELIRYYLRNAAYLRQGMQSLGFTCVAGDNSPYVWVHVKSPSWEVFDHWLNDAGVVCTPGVGFGRAGEQHVRLSAFNDHAKVQAAIARLHRLYGK